MASVLGGGAVIALWWWKRSFPSRFTDTRDCFLVEAMHQKWEFAPRLDTLRTFSERNDLRYLLFLHRSPFNLHLKKQCSIFHSVASRCCDSFPVALWVALFALFPVFTLAFPSQPFPGSLPLGSAWIKKRTQKGNHVQILTGSQDRGPLPAPAQSAWKAAIVPLVLSGP